ncbi:MAG: hypothetical protein ACRBCT_09270 [Alphaproteobacteria bacterium]
MNVFKKLMCGAFLASALVVGGESFSYAEGEAVPQEGFKQEVVTIYGHKYTLDFERLANVVPAKNNAYPWKGVGYLIPQILPGILDGDEVHTPLATAAILGDFAARYRDLFRKDVDKIAVQLDDMGRLDIVLTNVDPDKDILRLHQRVKEYLPTAEKEERVNTIAGRIHHWFWNNDWETYVAAYNDQQGDLVVPPSMFEHPHKMYKYAKALDYLHRLVRNSVEYEAYVKAQADKEK